MVGVGKDTRAQGEDFFQTTAFCFHVSSRIKIIKENTIQKYLKPTTGRSYQLILICKCQIMATNDSQLSMLDINPDFSHQLICQDPIRSHRISPQAHFWQLQLRARLSPEDNESKNPHKNLFQKIS